MKRWVVLGIVLVVLIAGVCLLGKTAVNPGDYTGDWYGAEDGRLYRFREGIITVPEDMRKTGDGFCGAYSFCRDSIVLFISDPDGESTVRQLYPAGEPKGEFLCESADGTGRIVFSRTNIAAQAERTILPEK